MNDLTSSTPSAAPASAPPSSSSGSTASTDDLATLAAPDNIEAYAEQRSDDHSPDDQHDDEGPSEADGADGSDEQRRQSTRADRRRRKMEALQERLRAATARKQEEAAAEQRTTELTPKLPPGVEEADNVEEWGEQLRAAAEIQNGQAENGADAAAHDGRPESREEFIERTVAEIQQANQQEAVRQRNEGAWQVRQQAAAAHLPYFEEVIAQPVQVGMQPDAAAAAWDAIQESNYGPVIEYVIKLPGPAGQQARAELKQATTPQAAVRVIGKIEGLLEGGRQQGHAPAPQPQRPLPASWSRKPIAPLRGSAAAPLSPNDRAGSGDKVDQRWAAERLREMRTRGR